MKFNVINAKSMVKSDLNIILINKKCSKNKTKSSKNIDLDIFDNSEMINQWCDKKLFIHANNEGFAGTLYQTFITNIFTENNNLSIGLIGLGDSYQQTLDHFRQAAGHAYKMANKKRVKNLQITIPKDFELPLFDIIKSITEGIILSSYIFKKYNFKSNEKNKNYLEKIDIVIHESVSESLKKACVSGQEIANSILLARDLINEPPIVLNPVYLAKEAQNLAKETGLAIEILDEKMLKKENMNLLLAVAQGACDFAPPRLIKLSYTPKKASKKTIVLIGKGVTFDSGGLDIKPADGMLDMKVDMSGAACVLASMQAIAKLNLNISVIGYMACVENSVSHKSYHPGDIFIARNGLSIEISNTDAEGRLILADTITYALDNDKPDIIIDVATLTGACMVALGTKCAGLFSNDNDLANSLLSFEKKTGEQFWRLPLSEDLLDGLKTPNADYKNCADRWGGSITAALFLQLFVDNKTKWAHLDIAGPATNNKNHPYLSNGGTGFGVRTLVEYLSSF